MALIDVHRLWQSWRDQEGERQNSLSFWADTARELYDLLCLLPADLFEEIFALSICIVADIFQLELHLDRVGGDSLFSLDAYGALDRVISIEGSAIGRKLDLQRGIRHA